MTLRSELDAFLDAWRHRAPPEAQALIAAQIEDLRAGGAEASVLQPGSAVPDIALPDHQGRMRRLRDLGPAVLVFYRGGWCPYCNLTLRAWQAQLPALTARGARLVAISPERPDGTVATVERNALSYQVLSDVDGAAMRAFGLDFALPQALRDLYGRFGHDLEAVNGAVGWRLPMPGTFVLDGEDRIAFARAEADYRRRAEPAEVLAALDAATRAVPA
jgi:peroxiredoxin